MRRLGIELEGPGRELTRPGPVNGAGLRRP